MNTITPQEASARIASYSGEKGLCRIRETVVGNHASKDWRDNHVIVPCGFGGELTINVQDCNIAIGGDAKRRIHREMYVCGKMVPAVVDMTIRANVERGMVWGKNISGSRAFLTIEGIPDKKFSHGFLFENCEDLSIKADVHDIGIQDKYLTGQGYGGELKGCVDSRVTGKFRNCRFGVVYSEAGWGNQAIDILGDENMIAEVDFHSGIHRSPVVIGVDRVRVGNFTHGAETISERFLKFVEIQRIAKG